MIRLRTGAGLASKIPKISSISSMTSVSPSVDKKFLLRPGHRLLIEGQAAIPFSEGNEVFYNKVQEFNRDLSVHVIKLFAEQRLREKEEKSLRRMRKVGTAERNIIFFRWLMWSVLDEWGNIFYDFSWGTEHFHLFQDALITVDQR